MGRNGLLSGLQNSGFCITLDVSSWRIKVVVNSTVFKICHTTGTVAFSDSSSTNAASSDMGISDNWFVFHCAAMVLEKRWMLSNRAWTARTSCASLIADPASFASPPIETNSGLAERSWSSRKELDLLGQASFPSIDTMSWSMVGRKYPDWKPSLEK